MSTIHECPTCGAAENEPCRTPSRRKKAQIHADRRVSLSAPSCADCGKPLTFVDENGMFCEDRCGYEQSRRAREAFFGGLGETGVSDD